MTIQTRQTKLYLGQTIELTDACMYYYQREYQQQRADSTSVDKSYFTLQKLFDVTLIFNYRGFLQWVRMYEYRGPKCPESGYFKIMLVPLSAI